MSSFSSLSGIYLINPAEPQPNARDLRLLYRIEPISRTQMQWSKSRLSLQNLFCHHLRLLRRPRRRHVLNEQEHARRKCSCRTSRRSMAMKVSFVLIFQDIIWYLVDYVTHVIFIANSAASTSGRRQGTARSKGTCARDTGFSLHASSPSSYSELLA